MKAATLMCAVLLLSVCGYGCGHTQVCRIGLLSVGDLQGKTIPSAVDGPVLVGKDASKTGGTCYYLSDAVRDALKGTSYDTLVDAEVTTTTGVFVWSNWIEVKGTALDSKTLPQEGGAQ